MDVDSLAQDKVWVSGRRAEPFYMAEILQCPEQALKELRLFERSSRQRAPLQSLRALMTTTSRTKIVVSLPWFPQGPVNCVGLWP
jgi:hypothetical protein